MNKILSLIKIRDRGTKITQHNLIITSKRKRGYAPRIETQIPIIINQINLNSILLQMNMLMKKQLNNSIKFSPRKIKENSKPPYSTLNPDTSSDSHSDMSNGVRLASIIKLIARANKICQVNQILKNKKFSSK